MSVFAEFTAALDEYGEESHNVGFCTNHGGSESLLMALPGHRERAAGARAILEELFTAAVNGHLIYPSTIHPRPVLGPSYDKAISEWNEVDVPERDGDGHDGKDHLRD